MAKILPGLAVSKMSGTVAGTTYQNWRGILVARSKPTPTNVATPRQLVVRMLMSLLSRAWRDELNQGLRTAWNQRAKNFPWLDVFGNTISMTGENLYIKQNMVLLDHSLPRQDTPVPDVMPPELTDLTIEPEVEQLSINVPQLSASIMTSQVPFLDIWVAGGFLTSVVEDTDPFVNAVISSQALPPGSIDSKSDYRHAAYANDKLLTEPAEEGLIVVTPPAGHTKNIAVIVRRYNKYGNFSAPRKFSAIITGG